MISSMEEWHGFQPRAEWLVSGGQVNRSCGPISSPSPSPVGSSLLGREPAAESISRCLCRVFRTPSAAKPLACISKAALPYLCAATFAARAAERFWPEGPDQLS